MKKEEFVKEYKDENEIKEISINTKIKLDLELTYDSNMDIYDGNSIAQRVIDCINYCTNIKHIKDYNYTIEPISIKLQNIETGEEEEVIDLLDDFYNPTLKNYYYKK